MTRPAGISSARWTTLSPAASIIEPMMMSLQTHVALTYLGSHEQHSQERPVHTVSDRDVVESAPSVSRLRRRLAQMHLAPAAHG
jgi:hypothetical protein